MSLYFFSGFKHHLCLSRVNFLSAGKEGTWRAHTFCIMASIFLVLIVAARKISVEPNRGGSPKGGSTLNFAGQAKLSDGGGPQSLQEKDS